MIIDATINPYCATAAVITAIRKHTPQEWTFILDIKRSFMPGQFVIVGLPGFGEAPFAVGGNSQHGIEITVRKIGRVTSGLFSRKVGELVWLRGPYGKPYPTHLFCDRHLLIIAGGSGVAAIKPLVEYYLDSEEALPRKLSLLLGFRNTRQILFREEIRRWSKHGTVFVTVDSHNDENEIWGGGIGFVVDFIKNVKNLDADTHAIVVGPPLMMTNCIRELTVCGVLVSNIWVSFERHMKCGIGKCGHCRIGEKYVCIDGPVFGYTEVRSLLD